MVIFIVQKKFHQILTKKADYPLCSINSVINEFRKGKDHGDKSFITAPNLFGITKPFISIEMPYCEINEFKSKKKSQIFEKNHKFTKLQ